MHLNAGQTVFTDSEHTHGLGHLLDSEHTHGLGTLARHKTQAHTHTHTHITKM